MIVNEAVEAHLHALQPSDDPVLQEMEAKAEAEQFPIIGPLVGRLCAQLARMIQARRVFELGSGFGYSTLWFARVVGPDGLVVHTDASAERTREARDALRRAGVAERVRFETGDAMELLAEEDGEFDIVFIDVDKPGYPQAWELARSKVRVGGLILCDNVLWQGKVADPDEDDEWTEAVREYDRKALHDPAFETTLLPLRDGVAVSLRVH